MKLSIITINYNNSLGLRKTLDSILCQNFFDYEQIVIDGGSKDESLEVILQYNSLINKRFEWISEPDNGIYHAMNKGIQKSQGEYCYFLNSGDYFANEKVLENVFKKDIDKDVIFGNLFVLFDNKVIGRSIGKDRLTFLDIYCGLVKHQAAFIRRSLFSRFGFYNDKLKIIADWEFFLKTMGLSGATYKYVDIDIACFDNNGISNKNNKLVAEERENVINRLIPSMMQSDYEFLQKWSKYKKVVKYSLSIYVIRLMTKLIGIYETLRQRT